MHCLGVLEEKNHGLVCKNYHPYHYGFIKITEAKEMSTEERYMKLSQLFKADHFRGIDLADGPRDLIFDRAENGTMQTREGKKDVAWIFFKGEKKKLRLTMANVTEFKLFETLGDLDQWKGKAFTLFARWEEHFGKRHFCARMKVANGQPHNPSQKETSKKPPTNHVDDIFDEVQERTTNYYKDKAHLFNALKKMELTGWPSPSDAEGIENAILCGIQYANQEADQTADEEY